MLSGHVHYIDQPSIALWPEVIPLDIKFIKKKNGLFEYQVNVNDVIENLHFSEKVKYLIFSSYNGSTELENIAFTAKDPK